MHLGMSMNLAPMQTLSLCCTECGQVLSKSENQATERECIEIECLVLSPAPVVDTKVCGKCRQPILERRG